MGMTTGLSPRSACKVLYNEKSVEPRKWAKAHFFVGVRVFALMREEILAKVHGGRAEGG